ncbi:MAG: DUF3108 domain-containing protein [Magnetococcales bacterium]|nr:DUF3108 domain-containing protein [Magnetococcales bacterium]
MKIRFAPRCIRLLVAVWLSASVFPACASGATATPLGALPGERLRYNIHWMGVPGGEAFMEVRPAKAGHYALVAGVESTGVVRLLHPIQDQLQAEGSVTASGVMSARYYAKHQQRGDQKRVIEYRFDREWGEVLRTQEGEESQSIGGVTPGVHDMLTGFYALRGCAGLKPGARIYVPMVDGKKVYQVATEVGEEERLLTPLGWFDVWPMTVMVGNSDLFRLQGSIVVWLTRDARRLPVRVESRIDFKSVAADLVAYDDARGERREWKESK